MELQNNADSVFVLRRLFLAFPETLIGLPVLFALVVLGIIVLLRQEKRLSTLLWGLGIIAAFSIVYVPLAFMFRQAFSWWVVLVPVLGVALFYVGLMYVKDAQSIHFLWAAFLGLCRCTVYAILAFVFLLPGCQDFDTTETFPKVLYLFDVSNSMLTKDDPLQPGQKPETLLTRQDKVIKHLTSKMDKNKNFRLSFMERVQEKTPVTAYRFGASLDESLLAKFDAFMPGKPDPSIWTEAQWHVFLHPNKKDIVLTEEQLKSPDKDKIKARLEDQYENIVAATNVPGAALQLMKAEASSYLQAVVIYSDGRTNIGSSEQLHEFLERVNNPKRKIPVFVVGVGEYRQPASIRIDDMEAPQTARPDDKFPLRVPVVAEGLRDEEFEVVVEATRVKDASGNPLKGEKTFRLGPKKGTFKGQGDFQQDKIDFEVDIQELKGIKAADDKARDLEGEWEFVAKVPRNPRESFLKEEHVSNPPTRVQVQNKELRILLFAGGPTRDYQFVRTLLFREMQEKRVEVAVYLQTASGDINDVDQDVPRERLLKRFPWKLGLDDPSEKFSSLNMFDVIIAFDPDWTALDAGQLKNLEQWVGRDAGGIIFVAGPVFSYALARTREDFQPLRTIYPVTLKDYRLLPLGTGLGIDMARPYALNFTKSAQGFDFLKIEETPDNPLAGWDHFFWGDRKPEPGKQPLRGMYNYYPVASLRPNSQVLATFDGPEATRINDGKDAQPYLVSMLYGNGKTVYVGSSESWRLRQYKESFHERFWIKMARYAASGSQQQKRYGRILMASKAQAGGVSIEAQIKGADLAPLSRDAKPLVVVKKLNEPDAKAATFEIRPKTAQGDWYGFFSGNFKLRDPGEYEFTIPIPGTSESLSHRIEIYRPNLEEANVRENFKELYQLASDAGPVLNKLSGEARRDIQRLLVPMSDDSRADKEGSQRLFFPLAAADSIADCLQKMEPRTESIKGRLTDLWDQGASISLYHLLWSVPLALFLLAGAISLYHEKMLMAGIFLGLAAVIPLSVVLVEWALQPTWLVQPIDFAFVLVSVVAILSVEWLTRKLLKLA